MAAQSDYIFFMECRPAKVIKLKVNEGCTITAGQVLVHYEYEDEMHNENSVNESEQNSLAHHKHVVRASLAGVVDELLIKEGDTLTKGTQILKFSSCSHPTVMKDMCAECGADLRDISQRNQTAAVAMVHNIPELMVSMEEAHILGKADEERLLKDRKLVLLVDLDQTLIHTTNDNIPSNIKDVYHFQLHGTSSPWYHTRLRPFTREFLKNMSSLYELHICTFGSRTYAHMIAKILDEEGQYFSHRILSRDECFSAHSKMANLKALFPCGDHMVVIIDDREDVWNYAPNLIHVRPYHFFQHTGDINAPPGLTKKEFDDKEGFDFSKLKLEKEEEKELNGTTLQDQTATEANEEKISKSNEEQLNSNGEVNNEQQCVTNKGEQENSNEVQEDEEKKEGSKSELEFSDSDDYLLHLQDILRTIHHAYYEIYDEMKTKNETKEIPDMKRIVPYVRRKVLQDVRLVFSGVVPTNIPLDKSRPFLVAKSLGATVMETVNEKTTHLIAARLGTAKLNDARKYKHIQVVTPDWLWCCAERWEHVEELLFPLNVDMAAVRRKPPPHCTSPDVALQLAIAAGNKEDQDSEIPVYDRVTGKRVFRRNAQKNPDKTGSWAGTSTGTQRPPRRFSETLNPLLSFSSEDIADMDREVEDILQGDEEEEEEDDGDEGDEGNEGNEDATAEAEKEEEAEAESESVSVSNRKRKHEILQNDNLIIGEVTEPSDPDNESILKKFRQGESISDFLDGEHSSEILDQGNEDEEEDEDEEGEDANADDVEDLEPDEDVADDSEWGLAGQALEREFLSGEED